MTFKSQWAALGYGRKRPAHMWRESPSKPLYARSNCGREVLAEQLRSAVNLPRCKVCERLQVRHD